MATGNRKRFNDTVKIKQEPQDNGIDTSIVKTERLPSFKVPRDLSLGGAGPLKIQKGAKKVFTPNLNAVRNKNLNSKNSRDTSARGKGRAERGKNERGRGRGGGGRGNLVQTSGVFSEGIGQATVRRSSSSSSFRSKDSDNYEYLRKPVVTKSDFLMDDNEEMQRMKEFIGDSDEDDYSNPNMHYPVKLSDSQWSTATATVIKVENPDPDEPATKHKTDPGYRESIVSNFEDLKVGDTKLESAPKSIEELFHQTEPQIFLMQLPDSLPGHDVDDTADTTPKGQDTQEEPPQNSSRCCLKQFEEGQIGKIVRYKSGNYKLILGDTKFNLDLGMQPLFLQELMSITTNREERSGNMINLGAVMAKLTATPDWEHIFKKFT